MNLYLSNGKIVGLFLVSSQTCASDSQNSKNISNVRFNYTTCQIIINTDKIMTNRLEEPNWCWAVIDNLDLEQEIEAEQYSFLFLGALALSFLESYYPRNLKPVQSAKWEHQRLDWHDHVTKLFHENRLHREYRMSLQAFNHLLEYFDLPSQLASAVKYNASSGLYSTNQHISPDLILAIGLR